jgi:hypothetical protein
MSTMSRRVALMHTSSIHGGVRRTRVDMTMRRVGDMQYVEVPRNIIILLPLLASLRSLGLFGSTVLTK